VSDAEVCIFIDEWLGGDFELMSGQAAILRRAFSIVHITFVIADRRAVPAMTNDKRDTANEK
jgi:hypothetical protein